MATVIDTLKARGSEDRAARHPEKQNRPDTPVLRKPDWLRVRAPGSGQYNETKSIVREHKLTTVCEEAACPNIGECWSQKHATMDQSRLVLGTMRQGREARLDRKGPGRAATGRAPTRKAGQHLGQSLFAVFGRYDDDVRRAGRQESLDGPAENRFTRHGPPLLGLAGPGAGSRAGGDDHGGKGHGGCLVR